MARVAMFLVLTQVALGAAMVLGALPPALRSLHQAVGVLVWIALFLATYLARIASSSAAMVRDVVAQPTLEGA